MISTTDSSFINNSNSNSPTLLGNNDQQILLGLLALQNRDLLREYLEKPRWAQALRDLLDVYLTYTSTADDIYPLSHVKTMLDVLPYSEMLKLNHEGPFNLKGFSLKEHRGIVVEFGRSLLKPFVQHAASDNEFERAELNRCMLELADRLCNTMAVDAGCMLAAMVFASITELYDMSTTMQNGEPNEAAEKLIAIFELRFRSLQGAREIYDWALKHIKQLDGDGDHGEDGGGLQLLSKDGRNDERMPEMTRRFLTLLRGK
ncbi:MAG: hypothetical protein JWR25_929 [Noviherbaspirillum sp.]|jgi:hypothetical protein|nr:hypothetical protein [Noviherbaspirillum sp.]